MLRACFMIAGYLVLCAGFVAAVIDGARSISAGALTMTFVGDVVQARFPSLSTSLLKVHPWLVDPALMQIMRAPLWLFLAVIGLALVLIVARKARKNGFAALA